MLRSRVLLTKFGGHRVYLSKLAPTWPQVTPTWPLTPAMHYTLVRGSSHQIWQPWAFLRQIDPWMTFDPRWGPFENMPTNLVGPSPTPMPSFSSIRRSMAKCIAGHTYTHTHTHTHTEFDILIITSGWPQHDLWPYQCITLWSGVLSTKFGGHRAFLRNLTSAWPWLTRAWPLILLMHYALVRASSHQTWWP